MVPGGHVARRWWTMTVSGRCRPASGPVEADEDHGGAGDLQLRHAIGQVLQRGGDRALDFVRAVLHDRYRRLGSGTGGEQIAADDGGVADPHVDREGRALGGQRVPIQLRLALGGGAGHDRELAHMLAQRHGQANPRSAGMRRRHAGDHLDVDVRGLQCGHFLGRAAEDEAGRRP